MSRTVRLVPVVLLAGGALVACLLVFAGAEDKKLDPAAWGSDHVGKLVPEYMSGDECLFCHRKKVAPRWPANRHNLSMRPASTEPAAIAALKASASTREMTGEVDFVLGRENRMRFLKRTGKFGQLALLSTEWVPAADGKEGKLVSQDRPHWHERSFGASCAGCHTTAVDPRTLSFLAVSLDCCTCHGDVPLEHARDTKRVYLSKEPKDPARVVVSICGQCHIRSGKSKSTGRPYANNFVAGDNLFRDFQVDWSEGPLGKLNPADQHVMHNVRDVALYGQNDMTCLSCHDVHAQSTAKHQELTRGAICASCHPAGEPLSEPKGYKVHSRVCGY